MPQSPIERIVIRRLVYQFVSQRVVERIFDQPLIGNVERGQYVECMVEFALSEQRPQWSLTGTWDPWDLVQADSGARIEVKNSAAAQTWTAQSPPLTQAAPSFDIAARTGYFDTNGWRPADPPARFADIYIFARNDVADIQEADHRDPDQWTFYVVPEVALPPQKSISLNPLNQLSESVSFDRLSDAVQGALTGLELKAGRDS